MGEDQHPHEHRQIERRHAVRLTQRLGIPPMLSRDEPLPKVAQFSCVEGVMSSNQAISGLF